MTDITNEWGTISFEVPDFLEDIRDTVNDFAELLITFLEIANTALEFIKAFVKAYLDPLVAIIESIVAEILAFLQDLKQIGIYITGDWELLGWPPEDLRGGFQAYERRMIARLADRTDPTRPDVSSATQVLALFGYLSVDPTDFERLMNFIVSMTKLFGLSFFPDTSRLPVPLIQDTQYSTNIFDFSSLVDTLTTLDGTPPHKCRITWIAQSASQKHPSNPFPLMGPSGYLITVSTIPDGLSLKYARPRSTTDKKGADEGQGNKVQPREYGDVLDPNSQPIKLYGGAEMLSFIGSEYEYNKGLSGGAVKDGACQVFGMLDPASNEIITLENLGPNTETVGTPGDGRGSEFYLQRTFLITDGATLAQWFAGEYSAVLDVADMPHHARWEKGPGGEFTPSSEGPASTYYVRVTSVGKQVAESLAQPKWDFLEPKYHAATAGQPFVVDRKSGVSSVGNPSASRKVVFAGSNTQEYLKALQTALLVLVLTRPDLPTLAELEALKGSDVAGKYREGLIPGEGFALNPCGLEDARGLLQRLYPTPQSLEISGQNPVKWRSDLYANIKRVAEELYARKGPNSRIEKSMVEATPDLRSLTVGEALASVDGLLESTWGSYLDSQGESDPLLLEAINPDNPLSQTIDFGLAPNPGSVLLDPVDVEDLYYHPNAVLGRDSDFVIYEDTPLEVVYEEADPVHVADLIQTAPEGLRAFYQMWVQEDGSLLVPDEHREALQAKLALTKRTSSGDNTPVFVVAQSVLQGIDRTSDYYADWEERNNELQGLNDKPWPALVNARGMMRSSRVEEAGGQTISPILAQAAMILGVAGAEKPPGDGEWIALRLFDTWPEIEEFLRAIEGWVASLADALKSVADTIIQYIEFVQAQIAELQQLIRRINALIQSFLGLTFALPQFSGLLLSSKGTDGVLADLASAQNKPSDSPLSYGGGIALVIPFAPSFIFDIVALASGGQDINQLASVNRPPDAVGTEGVAPVPGSPPTGEPDVL